MLHWLLLVLLAPTLAAGLGCTSVLEPTAAGTGFVSVQGRHLVAPDSRPLLLRGINLGGWLLPEGYMLYFDMATSPRRIRQVVKELIGTEASNAFWRRWHDTFITREDLRYIRAIGMNVVRVPFDYRLLTPEDHPSVWLEDGFELLDRVVRWSREEGLFVILDMHAAPCGQTGANIDNSYGYPHLFADPACRARTAAVWRRIAARYANERAVIGYDLLNEPLPSLPEYRRFDPLLEPTYKEIAAAIRQVDRQHVLFLSGVQWGHDFGVFQDVGFDPKLVYTFHRYWVTPIEDVFRTQLDFRERHEVPIFLGESGENHVEWVRAFREALERHEIGWSFWTYKRMDTVRSVRTYPVPPYWSELQAYQALIDTPDAEKRKVRPSETHTRAALEGLLQNVRFASTRVNSGYVRALGMTP
jgi:hypothetical protein